MLDHIINNPELDKFTVTFPEGTAVFVEGDTTQDLYILISGRLDVLKGDKTIAKIAAPGALFGEMSFLLGAKRTATVRADNDVKTLQVPKEQITQFLVAFPDVSREITKILAQRLDETSQVLFGLKEFCDQLPDAVLLTDLEGRVVATNAAADRLYGIDPNERHRLTVADIYVAPESYSQFLADVQSERSSREKTLKIRHPQKGERYISTSTTILYDGHNNVQGVLSLGRDVTATQTMENRYRRARMWLLPAVAMLISLVGVILYGYPYFTRGVQTVDTRKAALRNQMGKDFIMLKSLLAGGLPEANQAKIDRIFTDFRAIQEDATLPYTGMVLLDEKKKVVAAVSFDTGKSSIEQVGTSYVGLEFSGSQESLHRLLTLYRTSQDHPMGKKFVEVAFSMEDQGRLVGWLVFQMDMDLLNREFNVVEADLAQFRFNRGSDQVAPR